MAPKPYIENAYFTHNQFSSTQMVTALSIVVTTCSMHMWVIKGTGNPYHNVRAMCWIKGVNIALVLSAFQSFSSHMAYEQR